MRYLLLVFYQSPLSKEELWKISLISTWSTMSITIYSVADDKTTFHPALKSTVNHYHYIDTTSLFAKVKKSIFHYLNKHKLYYDYTIEFYLYKALKHIRHQNYDVIIMENRPGYALRLKAVSKAKLVYHLHNEKLSINIPRYQEIYDAATHIITVSSYIKSCALSINKNDTKTITVHNGIDTHRFSKNVQSLLNRENLGLSDNDFILVYSGRINNEKGVAELIDAMILIQDHPRIKLLIIGSSFFGNTPHDDDFVLSLKTKAKPIEQRIIFTGYVPYNQMPDYLQLADVAVIPSIWDDPFPTTVLEAQAMGLPIITTRRGGIPEEVTEKNAILLDTNDHFVENLANAILDLYENPEKRKDMTKASLERSKLFDKERYAEEFFRAIESTKE